MQTNSNNPKYDLLSTHYYHFRTINGEPKGRGFGAKIVRYPAKMPNEKNWEKKESKFVNFVRIMYLRFRYLSCGKSL